MTAPLRHARGPLAVIASLGLVLSACAAGAGDLGTLAPLSPAAQPSLDAPSPEATPGSSQPAGSPGATTTVRVYFILGSFTGDGGLVPVLRTVPKTTAVGAAAMNQLLAGPAGNEVTARPAMYTAIPAAARFLGLSVSGGIATVNVSREFAAGGTADTIVQRYAQVVYTLTQFPTVQYVRFELDGQVVPPANYPRLPALTDPIGRPAYVDELPAIFVDDPAWGGVLPNGGHVSGLANVFEAQARLRILDAAGQVQADTGIKATCGTGCWGSFDVTVDYRVPTAQWGTLRVYEPSAKDGSPIHIVDYPVWLTP